MATTEILTNPPEHEGWGHQIFHWAGIDVDGWLEETTNRAAFVVAGPDSFERAKALIATLPLRRMGIVMDRVAAKARWHGVGSGWRER